MKTEIWCEHDYEKSVDSFMVWSGNLTCVPREGDWVEIHEKWGMTRVRRVCYTLYNEPYALIMIGPDRTGEYKKALGEDNATSK